MYIFGGFNRGIRQNSVIVLDFETNKWSPLKVTGTVPQPRAGHSAVMYKSKMYVFGGKDEDNEKLKDLWVLDT